LCRAANAGQRVFDFMGEHRRKRDYRTGRAAMRELAIHLVGDGALLQHHDDVFRLFRQRRYMQVHQTVAWIAWRAEIDLVFIDGRTASAHLLDQQKERTAERHQFAKLMTPQQRQRNLKEGFGRSIGVDHFPIGGYNDDGVRQGIEHRIGRGSR
jgi:hypothetical protein